MKINKIQDAIKPIALDYEKEGVYHFSILPLSNCYILKVYKKLKVIKKFEIHNELELTKTVEIIKQIL